MQNYTYDKNTDYQALIDQAIAQGNYYMAAIYEQQRNAKITGEGMQGVSQTNRYSSYLPSTAGATTTPGGSAQTSNSYTNPYRQMLDAAIGKVTGNYAYDPDKDPIAAAYKKSYLREADRTMRDTLGEYATMTGGLPSAQAVAAASQSADNYKAQLSAALAELGQQAYDRDMNKVGLLMSAAQNEDNRYYTAISSAMNRWAQLGRADEQVASILGVPVGAMTGDAQYQQWQQALGEREYVLGLLASGVMPTNAQLASAGITAEQAQHLMPKASYTGGYSGGSDKSGKESAGKIVDWKTREELGELYKTGGEAAVASKLDYLALEGYDVIELMQWLISYYSSETDGYTGIGNPGTHPQTPGPGAAGGQVSAMFR